MTTNNHPANGPVSLDRLSLNDAIAHADERADALSGPCAAQHAQLAAWLRELQERRKADSFLIRFTNGVSVMKMGAFGMIAPKHSTTDSLKRRIVKYAFFTPRRQRR